MASKALPLLGFLLIAMLLVSAAVDATDTKEKETKISIDQRGGGYPYPGGGGGGYPYPGGGGRGGYPYPGGGGGGGGGGGYPYPGGGYPPWRRCRYRCCGRYGHNCWCCSRREFVATAEKHN
ncbi:unnamed protein product [Spirodela intermedia]|uniref:Uncharacterized protein n=1 Tax=Spirodela intermedia TaxID=51605 RepID=A0A7I8JJI9_SPIIN|nr:unnamed protein product [Spirodela intermedia]CAA6669592.1 unnamed protein product [Spirodela intermedia]